MCVCGACCAWIDDDTEHGLGTRPGLEVSDQRGVVHVRFHCHNRVVFDVGEYASDPMAVLEWDRSSAGGTLAWGGGSRPDARCAQEGSGGLIPAQSTKTKLD